MCIEVLEEQVQLAMGRKGFQAGGPLLMTAGLCANELEFSLPWHSAPKCPFLGLCKSQILTRLSPEKRDFAEPLKENTDTMDHIQSHLHVDLIISKKCDYEITWASIPTENLTSCGFSQKF